MDTGTYEEIFDDDDYRECLKEEGNSVAITVRLPGEDSPL